MKGKKKYTLEINAILDVSGSMSGGIIEQVLSYIFQKDITINLILIDTEVKDFIKIKKMSDLPKVKIKGLGGTDLQEALNLISDNKHLNTLNNVILSDGYLYKDLDFSRINGYNLVISAGVKIKYTGTDKLKQILVDGRK